MSIFHQRKAHADGAIGQFTIGKSGKGDINLSPNANQLVIIEAKMFSKLSKGIKNFSEYDQATRNVACVTGHPQDSWVPD